MALPANIKAHLQSESVGANTLIMTEVKGNISNSNNLTRQVVTKKFDEMESAEARAVDKVLRLPVKDSE